MPAIDFYLLDITYRVAENKPIIVLFARTLDGKRLIIEDDTFRPYFWIIPKPGQLDNVQEKLTKLKIQNNAEVSEISRTEIRKKNLNGKEVEAIKAYTNLPRDVPVLREAVKVWDIIESIHEYDILFVNRYMIDTSLVPMTACTAEGKTENNIFKAEKIKPSEDPQTLADPNILSLDIETYNPEGKQMDMNKNPILMIALHGKEYKKVLTWKRFSTQNTYIEFLDSEKSLLERFVQIIKEQNPDILTGYYSDGFDLPYIKTRAEINKVNLDIGMDNSPLKISSGMTIKAYIAGIPHFDVFRFISKIIGRSLDTETYGLDAIAEEMLGIRKQEVDLDNLYAIWDNNPEELERFCTYNLHDAFLTYQLAVKNLPTIVEMVKIVGLTLYEVNRMGFSQLVEWYLLKEAKAHNQLAPNKPSSQQSKERLAKSYQGAFVFQPKPGLYKDIMVYDYRSLYPSIISSHNISPATFNCTCCSLSAKKVPLEGKEWWFCEKQKGFIPLLIEELITRRMRIKEILRESQDEFLKARSNALKLLGNSFYGYLGFYMSRWYSLESASSTTALARFYIHKVIDGAQAKGFEVIYSDTDSVFFLLKENPLKKATDFVAEINRDLPGLMELEYEGHYPAGIFVSAKLGPYGAKKKYALLSEKREIKIRGFETVRRNWSAVAKETQIEVLNIILKEQNPEKAFNCAQAVIRQLRERKVPCEKVIMYTRLQKEMASYEAIGPHVAAARRMQQRGQTIALGSLIKFIITPGS